MRRYETITILNPSLGEDDIQAVIDRSTGIIEDFKGSIVKIDRWGLKKLAYLINKEQQGYYIYLQYAGVPDAINELERIYRIDDRVSRIYTALGYGGQRLFVVPDHDLVAVFTGWNIYEKGALHIRVFQSSVLKAVENESEN